MTAPASWRADPMVRAQLTTLTEEWLDANPGRDEEALGEVVYTLFEEREAAKRVRAELATANEALRRIDAICADFAEGRISAYVALGKIGLLRLYPVAVLSPNQPEREHA